MTFWQRGKDNSNNTEEWKQYDYKIRNAERAIERVHYQSALKPVSGPTSDFVSGFFTIRADASENTLSLPQAFSMLSAANLGPPHGRDLLRPIEPPKIDDPPKEPNSRASEFTQHSIARSAARLTETINKKREAFAAIFQSDIKMLEALSQGYASGEPKFVEYLSSLSLTRHYLPRALRGPATVYYDAKSRTILCEPQIPNFSNIKFQKQRSAKSFELVPAGPSDKKKASEAVLYSTCIRAAYLIAMSDFADWIDTVAINARQQWFDPATGATCEGIVASLQATKVALAKLQPDHIEPKPCFLHLKGIATPSVERTAPVRPIFVLNTSDNRVIQNRDVADTLDGASNLAAIPWDDFEHLVRQLFEWEFGKNGVEVKVTRASRDRGVDAIMYDPDPLRGGKYVLQAKRYTRTVDVASVRDLYGTVMNEGANRGILVTTSSFGPDAYEFAKDKPISLVDGPNLIAMLNRHGRAYKIDLMEARRLNAETNDPP